MPIRPALLLLLAVALPCLAAAGATDIVAVDDFINAPRALFGRNRASVERRLGAPASVRSLTLPAGPNFPAEAADELVYPGVAVAVSRRSSTVRRVEIGEPRFTLPRGLNVGAARREVERILGEPQLTDATSVLYLDADGYPNTVEFQFREERVRRIEWTFAPGD